MNRIIAHALLGVISILVTACSTSLGINNLQNGNKLATYQWPSQSDTLSVPFEWHDGHLIIPVTINGSEPLRLAFDSGASVTVLFESARTAGLKLNVERQLTLSGSGTTVNITNGNTVGVAGLELKNLTALHVPLDNSPIFTNIEETYFDGAIGYDLLSRFTVRIDYVNQLITLTDKPAAPLNAAEWQALAIDISTRVPYLQALLNKDMADTVANNKPAKLLVDTGAPFYLYINPKLHPALELPTYYYETKGEGFNGPYHRLTGRLDQLTVGQHHFHKLATHFDTEDFDDLAGIGLLGNALLKNFDLIFDYASETLLIRKHSKFSANSVVDKSGLDVMPHSQGAIAVSVAPNTGAYRAGIRSGNVITHFNQELISRSNYDEFEANFSSDKDTIELCWNADPKNICGQVMLSARSPDAGTYISQP